MYTCICICIKYGGITLRNWLMRLWELVSSNSVSKLEMQEEFPSYNHKAEFLLIWKTALPHESYDRTDHQALR